MIAAWKQMAITTYNFLSRWYCSYTLKMEVIRYLETSVDFQRITLRYIPEDSTLHNHRCQNLTSYIRAVLFLKTVMFIRPFPYTLPRGIGRTHKYPCLSDKYGVFLWTN
jgi:hypothetical protein